MDNAESIAVSDGLPEADVPVAPLPRPNVPSLPAVAAAPDAPAPTEYPVTVGEFLIRHSRDDKRVELLSAFHAEEAARGPGRALSSDYLARLDAFAARPVA